MKIIQLIQLSIPFIFLNISCEEVESKLNKVILQEKIVKIGIQPFNNFDEALSDSVKSVIKEIYGFEVIILESTDLPEDAYTNIKSPRYRADSLLRYLRKIKPDSIDHILGLTEKDVSVTKTDIEGNIKKPEYKYKDWGVFGLAFRPGTSCIVSTFRIRSVQSKFIERFKKICIHELGHNLGLKHCSSNDSCVMRDAAETIKTIDFVALNLCSTCKKEIGLK